MSAYFQPGEVVHLKSGGMRMTVRHAWYLHDASGNATQLVLCVWFDGSRCIEKQFESAVLVHFDEEAR